MSLDDKTNTNDRIDETKTALSRQQHVASDEQGNGEVSLCSGYDVARPFGVAANFGCVICVVHM